MGLGSSRSRDRSDDSEQSATASTPAGHSQSSQRSNGPATTGRQAERRYGVEVESTRQLTQLQRLEQRVGVQRIRQWSNEGMPIDAMETPQTVEAFRQRKGTPVPWNVEERNEQSVQRSQEAAADTSPAGDAGVPDTVRDVISSQGRSLDPAIQRAMEERMDDSFDDVRVHTGPTAAQACDSIDARAFTVGNHVAFNRGEYDPSSSEGQHVLAHELAHVRQQTGGGLSRLPRDAVVGVHRTDDGESGAVGATGTTLELQRLPDDSGLGDDLGPQPLPDVTEEEVRELIEGITFEFDGAERPEVLGSMFAHAARKTIDRIQNPSLAARLFEHLDAVDYEPPDGTVGGVSTSTGTPDHDATMSLSEDVGPSTVHHELAHALADSLGLGLGEAARENWRDRYDRERNNFPAVPYEEFHDHMLKRKDYRYELPPEFAELQEAVNDAWEETQQAHRSKAENEHMYTMFGLAELDNYTAVHAHETLANFHQQLQADERDHPLSWFYRHGDLLDAYLDVFEPCYSKQQLIAYLHRHDPAASPLDEDPFPELDPDRDTIRADLRQLTKRMRASDELPDEGYYELDNFG